MQSPPMTQEDIAKFEEAQQKLVKPVEEISTREKLIRDVIAQNIRPEYTRQQRREVERKIRKKFTKITIS